MQNTKVSFTPTQEQLNQIEQWLKEEHDVKKTGFYVNWHNSVIFSQAKGRMAIVIKDEISIGFMTWFPENERITEIQITEIRPGYRKKGYAKILLQALTDKLIPTGTRVFTLHCQPAVSESAWKKLGFVPYPKTKDFSEENSADGKHLYKILTPYHQLSTEGIGEGHTIELWAAQPLESDDLEPQWRWKPIINPTNGKLETPIISPAKYEWKIRWSANGKVINEDKVKYFATEGIDFSDFIIIDKLPLS